MAKLTFNTELYRLLSRPLVHGRASQREKVRTTLLHQSIDSYLRQLYIVYYMRSTTGFETKVFFPYCAKTRVDQ